MTLNTSRYTSALIYLSLFAGLCTTIFAQGWERPVQQDQPAYTATPAGDARTESIQKLYGDDRLIYGPRYGEMPSELFSQTLDAAVHPLSYFLLTMTPDSTFGTFDDTATLEMESALRIFAFEEFLAGYLEGSFKLRLLGYLSDTGIAGLPDVAAHLAFDMATSWRFWTGWSLELGVAPGIYSDISDPQFNCLVTANLHYAFNPEFAMQLGLTVRPDWKIPVYPNVGFAWQPHDALRIEAMLPRSMVQISPFSGFALFGTIEWRNFDFYIKDKPDLPDSFTVNEVLATAGLSVGTSQDTRLTAEFGTYFTRGINNDASGSRLSISKEWLVRVGWHGAF